MINIQSIETESQWAKPTAPYRLNCTTISPQSDDWNHVRPSQAIVDASGINAGDHIKFGRHGNDLIIIKDPDSKFRARHYKYGRKVQYSFREDWLPTGLVRGERVPFADATVTAEEGCIVIPGVWK